MVIAIKDGTNGKYTYNPQSNVSLKTNDTLIAMGTVEQISKLKEFTNV